MSHLLQKLLPYIILSVAGFASFFAFSPYRQVWIMFLTIPCLVFYINEAKTKKQAVFQAGLFGGVFFETSLFWAVKGLFSEYGLLVYFLFVLFLFLMGFFFYGTVAFLSHFFKKGLSRIIAFCCLLSLSEYVQSYFIFQLSWLFMASAWVSYPKMLQFFSIAGTFGYGFFTVFIFTSPLFLLTKEKHYKTFILAVILAGGIFLYGDKRLENTRDSEYVPDINLRLVQKHQTKSLNDVPAYITPVLFDNEIYFSLKKPLAVKGKNILFFPEAFIRSRIQDEPLLFQKPLEREYPDFYILTGSLRKIEGKKVYNSILAVDNKARILNSNDKYKFVPVGEYIPFIENFRDFSRGKGPKTFHLAGIPAIGAVNCVEITYPRIFIDQKDRPKWIANITNDSVYLNELGSYQYLIFSQLRAVEEGLPVVKISTPYGISAVINPYGEIEAFLPRGTTDTLDAKLPKALPPTFYAKYGNIPFLLGSFLLLVACAAVSSYKKNIGTPDDGAEVSDKSEIIPDKSEKAEFSRPVKTRKEKEKQRQQRAEKRKKRKKQ